MESSIQLTYDGTYEGLISVVFEAYRLKLNVEKIVPLEEVIPDLFAQEMHVETNLEHVDRIFKALKAKLGSKGTKLIHRAFLSEQRGIEMNIYRVIQKTFKYAHSILENYADDDVLKLHQINKKISREVHRMHAFVRFQETTGGLYTALVNPDFNVLPLIGDHFKKRYPAQHWLIYDTIRHYGIAYYGNQIEYTTIVESDHQRIEELLKNNITADEAQYQSLWKSYFEHVNIPARVNMKLHIQHVPKRYWKYLIEKAV